LCEIYTSEKRKLGQVKDASRGKPVFFEVADFDELISSNHHQLGVASFKVTLTNGLLRFAGVQIMT
jgi:hypothetical protein